MEQVQIESRSQDELVQIAKDMIAQKVFYDGLIPEEAGAMIYEIFLPLRKVEDHIDWNDVGMIYEYTTKSIDNSNSAPVFKTINFIHTVDMFRLTDIMNKLLSEDEDEHKHVHDDHCGCDH